MKRCQACGYPIEGEARELAPEAMSGGKPTMHLHATPAGCREAKDQRRPELRRNR